MNEELGVNQNVPVAGVLITHALGKRSPRSSSLQTRTAAFREIDKLSLDDSQESLVSFLEVTRRLNASGSAGMSVLRKDASGSTRIRWESIAGALAAHQGDEFPLQASPCGLCIDANATVLLRRPERAYSHLKHLQTPIVENLIAPLYDAEGSALGTLWVARHDSRSGFSPSDAYVLEQLASRLMHRLQMLQAADEHRHTLAALRWGQDALLSVTRELREEHMARARAETSEAMLRQTLLYKDAAIHEAHHRVKNSLQIAASLLSIHVRNATSPEVGSALVNARERLHVLAQVHQLLYRDNDDAQEVLMSTLFAAVGEALRISFAERAMQITLTVAAEPIRLSPDRATPLALLANEVLTNAYKHAFPGAATGAITLHFNATPNNTLTLQIADNGVGMQALTEHATLGVRLVRIFAKQLHGELSYGATADLKGTTMTLTLRDEQTVVAQAAAAVTRNETELAVRTGVDSSSEPCVPQGSLLAKTQ